MTRSETNLCYDIGVNAAQKGMESLLTAVNALATADERMTAMMVAFAYVSHKVENSMSLPGMAANQRLYEAAKQIFATADKGTLAEHAAILRERRMR